MRVERITLKRAEGPCSCSTFAACSSWEEADAVLLEMSETAPRDGSYHKVDFEVAFEGGLRYEGVYYLKHFSVESPDLRRHIRAFIELYLGETSPGPGERG